MRPKRSVILCSLWFRLKGTKNGQRQQRLHCGSSGLWISPHWPDLFAKKLQSCAVLIGYCFPVLLWCCQRSLNLLIAFHQSGPEPQNACSALPCRQGSDSLFFCRMCHSQAAGIQIQQLGAEGVWLQDQWEDESSLLAPTCSHWAWIGFTVNL